MLDAGRPGMILKPRLCDAGSARRLGSAFCSSQRAGVSAGDCEGQACDGEISAKRGHPKLAPPPGPLYLPAALIQLGEHLPGLHRTLIGNSTS